MNKLEKAIADAVYGDYPDGPGPIEVSAGAALNFFKQAYADSQGDFDYVVFVAGQEADND